MAPTKNKSGSSKLATNMNYNLKKILSKEFIKKLLFDLQYLWPVCIFLLILEFGLNLFIIQRVKYTEIDWIAYMQEVEGFLNGTLDYKELKGDTGPLVYPAGFVYIYSVFYYVTSQGKNIYLAQHIFLILYLLQTYLVQRIFRKTMKIPPYALVIATLTSYRIHSIFVLRLFNDPIAVLLFYISLNLLMSNRWFLGSLFYSLAVSVKMNILLYAPCLLLAYLTNLTYLETIANLFICGIVQLILGLPFLYGNPVSYLKGSFDLGRVFEYKWTVNFRFLQRDIFESKYLHIGLLVIHIVILLIFLPQFKRYFSSYAKLSIITDQYRLHLIDESKKSDEKLSKKQKNFLDSFEKQLKESGRHKLNEESSKMEEKLSKVVQLFVLPFFVTNLIGVACARSLHYQFYCWYFHSLLYMVFSTEYRSPLKFLILGLIEYCWNVYPSTNFSSALLHCCHITLLVGLYKHMKK